MYFIGEERHLVTQFRDGYYSDVDEVSGYCLDASDWVAMGGSFALDPSLGGSLAFGARSPRGLSFWDCPSARHNRSMKTEHENKSHVKVKRGGARPGAGRKALDDDGTIVITARLTGKQKAAYDMAGGVQWLRGQLDLFTGEVS